MPPHVERPHVTPHRHAPCHCTSSHRTTARRATAPPHAERPHIMPPLRRATLRGHAPPHVKPLRATPCHAPSSHCTPRTTTHCTTPHREAACHAPLPELLWLEKSIVIANKT